MRAVAKWSDLGCVHAGRFVDKENWIEEVCPPAGIDPKAIQELEAESFIQDPDVLDTWFSSALWPHSTLGWPEDTAALRKWYPTSVLLTGRDIITLWVARMVMTGMYNMGQQSRGTGYQPVSETAGAAKQHNNAESHGLVARATSLGIPFHHVAINPTILDGKGERMSKSKGNGVDPVEIIDTHGADALRFTLTTMATETQDARLPVRRDAQGRNTSEKFDLGRNFCNKIWNAVRFALANLAAIPEEKSDEATKRRSDEGEEAVQSQIANRKSQILDAWILSRLMSTIKESNDALAVYRFDQYAKACYDFFWRDLCDWYIEAVKPELKPDAPAERRAQAGDVLAACLDVSLRLLHPIIPFITETIWWKFNEVRPSRLLAGISYVGRHEGTEARRHEGGSDEATKRRSDEGGNPFPPRLILAPWPSFNEALVDPAAESAFARVQEIDCGDPEPAERAQGGCEEDRGGLDLGSGGLPPGSLKPIAQPSSFWPHALSARSRRTYPHRPAPRVRRWRAARYSSRGLVDADAEKHRVAKRREELTKQRGALRGRLASESYVAKAPPQLVQQTRDQLAAVEAELARLG